MTLLPIVTRELRVASRRSSTYWTRFTAAMLATGMGAFAWILLFRQSARETGLAVFVSLSAIAFLYCFLAGVTATADSVSEEKREGTLGLLFLTDLRPYDIVSGKLVASSVTAIYGLLSIFPVMGVPLLLGGVAPAEFGRVLLVCGNLLFLSLTLGLVCSTLCQDERKAQALTIFVILMLAAGWPFTVMWISSELRPGHPLYRFFHDHVQALLSLSPGFPCVFAFDQPYRASIANSKINWFYVSVALTHLYAWIAFALSTWILPRVWRDKVAPAKKQTRSRFTDALRAQTRERRLAFRRYALEQNPVYWLAARVRSKFFLVWLVLGLGALMWFLAWTREGRNWLDEGTFIWTGLGLHTLFKWWVALEAPRQFGQDRRSGAIELILSTPLSVDRVLRGQAMALIAQFGPAVLLVCVIDVFFLVFGFRHVGSSDHQIWIAMWLAGLIIFIVDLVAIASLAMWRSLVSRKPGHAPANAVVAVCVLPWTLFGIVCAALVFMEEVLRQRTFLSNATAVTMIGMWFVISLAIAGAITVSSIRKLRRRFRDAATQRLESTGARLGRWLGRKFAHSRR